jgi:hypothetical protein
MTELASRRVWDGPIVTMSVVMASETITGSTSLGTAP